jgi:hypothetical protein
MSIIHIALLALLIVSPAAKAGLKLKADSWLSVEARIATHLSQSHRDIEVADDFIRELNDRLGIYPIRAYNFDLSLSKYILTELSTTFPEVRYLGGKRVRFGFNISQETKIHLTSSNKRHYSVTLSQSRNHYSRTFSFCTENDIGNHMKYFFRFSMIY